MHAYLINDGNNIHSLEAGNRKYIETMITLIKQQKSSDANLSKRHIDFLSLTELKYNLRKKEFNEYFGDKLRKLTLNLSFERDAKLPPK